MRRGFLEGMDRVAQNVIAEQGLESPAVHHVAGTVEEFVDGELQPGVLEDPHGPMLIEFYQHIDIAVLVELDEHRSMGIFEYARLKFSINELLDGAGDVVNRRTLKPLLRDNILRDAIHAF